MDINQFTLFWVSVCVPYNIYSNCALLSLDLQGTLGRWCGTVDVENLVLVWVVNILKFIYFVHPCCPYPCWFSTCTFAPLCSCLSVPCWGYFAALLPYCWFPSFQLDSWRWPRSRATRFCCCFFCFCRDHLFHDCPQRLHPCSSAFFHDHAQ